MKKFKHIFLLVLIQFSTFCLAQDYIGKDFSLCKKELKNLLSDKGFTFIKEQKKMLCGLPSYATDLLFSKELRISFIKNKSDKITSVLFYSQNKKTIDEIKSVLKYPEWKHKSKESDREIYSFNDQSFSMIEKRSNSYTEYGISIQK